MNTPFLKRIFLSPSVWRLGVLLTLLALTTTSAHAATTRPPDHPSALLRSGATITWLGAGGDARWSNPANWAGGVVPGPSDVARFAAAGSTDARADAGFGGVVAGIVLEQEYTGTLRVERDLLIAGDLTMAGGTFAGEARDCGFKAPRASAAGH